MAIEYKPQAGLEAIMTVLDEYVVWYGKLVKAYFENKPTELQPPVVFHEWLIKAKADKAISTNLAERISRIHDGMVDSAVRFSRRDAYHTDHRPLKEYNDLTGYYEEFIHLMHRLEFDTAVENTGFDEKTGLRSPKLMHDDYGRELERRARRGNPFSLALVKINHFDPAWERNEESFWAMIKKISHQIKQCLRSFDDAYYMGGEYFLLSVKHADMIGSQAAISRFNQIITSTHIPAPDDPIAEISIATVVSEPSPGDTLDDLLAHMKSDLEGIDSQGTVLQYSEISPLQRYLHSMGKDK